MADSPTAGVFTCTALQKVIAKIDEAWADNQQKMQYVSQVEVVTAIRKEQTARLQAIEDPNKDNDFKIYWVIDCNTGVEDDDGDDCDFDGPEAESRCQDYVLDIKKSVTFKNKQNMGRTNDIGREDALAVQMLNAMKQLDEIIAQTVVTKLNSFAGVNQFTGGIGDVDGVTTYIAPSYWGGDMYGYFAQVVIMNKLSDPFMIHGSNLFQQNWQAPLNGLNQNQKDQAPKLNSIRSYWDMFNVDSINSPDQVSYLITRGAVAIANKAYYPKNSPTYFPTDKPSYRWSIESKSIPGIWYDVVQKMVCVGEDIVYIYKMKAKFGVYKNPFGCNDEVSGIIKFACGLAPAS